MQVLDSGENYIVLYKCLETIHYTDTKTEKKLTDEEAWKRSEIKSVDFTKRPIVEFKNDGTMKLEQFHF